MFLLWAILLNFAARLRLAATAQLVHKDVPLVCLTDICAKYHICFAISSLCFDVLSRMVATNFGCPLGFTAKQLKCQFDNPLVNPSKGLDCLQVGKHPTYSATNLNN